MEGAAATSDWRASAGKGGAAGHGGAGGLGGAGLTHVGANGQAARAALRGARAIAARAAPWRRRLGRHGKREWHLRRQRLGHYGLARDARGRCHATTHQRRGGNPLLDRSRRREREQQRRSHLQRPNHRCPRQQSRRQWTGRNAYASCRARSGYLHRARAVQAWRRLHAASHGRGHHVDNYQFFHGHRLDQHPAEGDSGIGVGHDMGQQFPHRAAEPRHWQWLWLRHTHRKRRSRNRFPGAISIRSKLPLAKG